ncbi:hypothetical protein BVG79_p4000002 (plasmid) [Ketogulonicigenium robustum]|uniref:Uncharacterized protein n=2 Tax=Ketogulonicigenium robustum TaxID=92947 RepID=A0A1W6P3G5_9RHOB|nr:hypothetical protein BVG79_p4000002 [Ketogulonicigenium robustum]
MKAAVRCSALDMAGLSAAEKHAKRQDKTSAKRVVRDASPLVYKTLDLRSAYDAHTKGVRQNKAAKKPVLHFIVRFPPELLDERRTNRSKEELQRAMVRQAVEFINETHGGNAVFAARLDRDEAGESIVDVFASPVYEKRTKRTPPDQPGEMWSSATKFGRELADKHREEIQRRHSGAAPNYSAPRAVGIALQSEFAAFFERRNNIKLEPKREKSDGAPDRLETEAFKAVETERTELKTQREQLDAERAKLDAAQVDFERQKSVAVEAVRAERKRVSGLRGILVERLKSLDEAISEVRKSLPRIRRSIQIALRLGSRKEVEETRAARTDAVKIMPQMKRTKAETVALLRAMSAPKKAPEKLADTDSFDGPTV